MELGPTDVVLFGVRLQEIDIIITDLIWSLTSLYAFIKLTGIKDRLSTAGNWFRWFFLLMAIAVFLGAFLGHGFQYVLGYEAKYPGWIVSMWGVACMERSAIIYAGERVSDRLSKFMSIANVIELIIFHGLILYTGSFYFVEIHAAYGLVIIAFPLHLMVYRQTTSQASKLVLIGIAVASLASIVHLTGFGFGIWFNFHDVSHVILTVSTVLYYFAARNMQRDQIPAVASATAVQH